MRHDDPAFLGRGWSFPPSFSRTSASVDMVSGAADIHQSLWILLSTSIGERIMVPGFGCSLIPMLLDGVTVTFLTKLQDVVRTAILDWEPRITVDDVYAVDDHATPGLVRLTVEYTIRATNARSNLVYPFYLREATIAPQAP